MRSLEVTVASVPGGTGALHESSTALHHPQSRQTALRLGAASSQHVGALSSGYLGTGRPERTSGEQIQILFVGQV